MKNTSKSYFVFTDNLNLCSFENVYLIEQKCEGFPNDSLFRFDMFLKIKNLLLDYDYTFFLNSNMLFVQSVNENILPNHENGNLLGVISPAEYRYKLSAFFPYERNKKSSAYIKPYGKKYHYFMGGFNGGKTEDYLILVESLSNNIKSDYSNGIVAIYHDESHINNYFRQHKCLILKGEYGWPEGWNASFTPKIIIRDKVKYSSYFNKGRDNSYFGKLKKIFLIIYRAFIWYL
jgi:hypothetical protein